MREADAAALAAFCGSKSGGEAVEFSAELRRIVEMSAESGKYWHDWCLLKELLHFRLNQVVKELYDNASPSASASAAPVSSANGRDGSEKALYDVLHRLGNQLAAFEDAAPFTLQRICELLVAPPASYSSIDKFELAFEKLLLVTSTLPVSAADSYPESKRPAAENPDNGGEEKKKHELDQS